MSKKIFLMLFLVLFSYSVLGAEIHGSVYDLNLDIVNDVVVGINTEPKQTFVVKNGSYSFIVPSGDYTIIAVHRKEGIMEAEEDISVKEEGSYVLDLILFPTLEEEESLEDLGIDIEDSYFKDPNYWPTAIVMVILLTVVIFALYKYNPQKGKMGEKESTDGLVNFIKKQGGRTTQKDIRKEFPSSEAKISLMITELEKKGKIEKIKKGRGNIIILK